jgi:hypothetical protein
MKLMIMYPITGETTMEENKFRRPDIINTSHGSRKNKIEIHNSEGNLVGVVTKRSLIKMLNLEQGFYLVRERDKNSRIINSGMMLI